MSLPLSMRLSDIQTALNQSAPTLSFEIFPAKTEKAIAALKETVDSFALLSPDYISVTYGAGGTTQDSTKEMVSYVNDHTPMDVAAHLTCVGASKDEVNAIADAYLSKGVNKIVALRGDLPGMEGVYTPHENAYAYADDLVKGLMSRGDFDISVAAYPETHPQALSPMADIEHLKRKQDAGAKRAITQFCFDTNRICEFTSRARDAGVTMPIVPGIVLVHNFAQLVRFAGACGATVPLWMHQLFADAQSEAMVNVSANMTQTLATLIAYEQCRLLMDQGFDTFHIYTLNKMEALFPLCRLLGVTSSVS